MIPEDVKDNLIGVGVKTVIDTLMRTAVWGKHFQSLKAEYKGSNRPLDLRCGFSKAFMEGKLESTHITQVQFHAGNVIEFKGQVGCALVVFESEASLSDADDDEDFVDDEPEVKSKVEEKFEAYSRNEPKVEGWNNHRSFFFSTTGDVKFDFSAENKYKIKSLV